MLLETDKVYVINSFSDFVVTFRNHIEVKKSLRLKLEKYFGKTGAKILFELSNKQDIDMYAIKTIRDMSLLYFIKEVLSTSFGLWRVEETEDNFKVHMLYDITLN
jgi:hypothetical protein